MSGTAWARAVSHLIVESHRVKAKQLTSFLRGLMLSCHLKCKKPQFLRSLEEAKM